MPLHMRPYEDTDLPRLQAALAGWIREAGICGYGHVGDLPHRIYAGLRGRRPVGELVQVWEDGPEIVGAAINFRFDGAFDVLTCPSLRGGEAELAMLRSAWETTLRHIRAQTGGDGPVHCDVYSCDSVRRELLGRLGFVEYRSWDDVEERDLSAPIPTPALPAGYSIRPAALADAAQLAAAHGDAFGEQWTPEEYRDQVMLKPGYDPARELVAVGPGGQIAAFTIIWLDGLNRVGLFEPVGTRSDSRRLGLARALLCHAMEEMRRLGMETAMVGHDATNQPAAALYRGLGFMTRYETLGYRRE
jgi:mycothiol synthase